MLASFAQGNIQPMITIAPALILKHMETWIVNLAKRESCRIL